VFAHSAPRSRPARRKPYGLFRMDYVGKKNGATGFNGFIDSQAGSISSTRPDRTQNNTAMALSASSTIPAPARLHERRRFLRLRLRCPLFPSQRRQQRLVLRSCQANAQKIRMAVWDLQRERRVASRSLRTRDFPSWPRTPAIRTTDLPTTGASISGTRPQRYADAQPISGLTVVDQRPATTRLSGLESGRQADQVEQQATTLDSLNNIFPSVSAVI